MEVKKIANFSTEEVEALQKAGTILGGLAKALAAGEVDGLDDGAYSLIAALKEVVARV